MSELSEFHDVRFPLSVAFGATGGPERRNEIISLTSGREKRNARTAHSRRRYDAGTGVRSLADLYEVISFFEARRGSLHGFRFRDPFDMKSCQPDQAVNAADQSLGSGDGTKRRFSLCKTYGSGAQAYMRPIRKPLLSTLVVAINGVTANTWEFDDDTGDIVFAPGSVPPGGAQVTAGYEFDVPVRFDTDSLSASLTAFKAGQFPAIPLLEVRL
ncbi:MAG: DUF2460 domain-containing protein [Rhizobiaceae bacterium]|nr:DUF2460 domain-containing protein [Rhizobiaceae bacterium]